MTDDSTTSGGASSVINLADMRKKLRPPQAPPPYQMRDLMRTLANIDAVRQAARSFEEVPTDG